MKKFRDAKGSYTLLWHCKECGWSIEKCEITKHWFECRLCGAPIVTYKNYYPYDRR